MLHFLQLLESSKLCRTFRRDGGTTSLLFSSLHFPSDVPTSKLMASSQRSDFLPAMPSRHSKMEFVPSHVLLLLSLSRVEIERHSGGRQVCLDVTHLIENLAHRMTWRQKKTDETRTKEQEDLLSLSFDVVVFFPSTTFRGRQKRCKRVPPFVAGD